MSVEPTCAYCGASDKNRCKNMEEARHCTRMMAPPKKLYPDIREDIQAQYSIKLQSGVPVSIETHSKEKAATYKIKMTPVAHSEVFIGLDENDLDRMIQMLVMVRDYTKT